MSFIRSWLGQLAVGVLVSSLSHWVYRQGFLICCPLQLQGDYLMSFFLFFLFITYFKAILLHY